MTAPPPPDPIQAGSAPTMRAIVRERYGGPEVLRLADVPIPEPGRGEVRVRVRAASLNRADLDYLTGKPALTRLLIGVRAPRLTRPGLDAAGEAEAVGAGVTTLRIGDRVVADLTQHRHGAFAERACAPASAWHRIPDGVSFADAATLPQAGVMALQGLGGVGGVRAGQRVLVNGASGNIGTWAVQLARNAGATVTGVSSASKIDLVAALGADLVLDPAREDVTRRPERYDRILDPAGARSVWAMRRALAPGGVYVSYGGLTTWRLVETLVGGPLLSIGQPRRMGMLLAWKPNDPTAMAWLLAELAAGRIRPVVDRTWSLEEVPEAFARLAGGAARGKQLIEL